MPNFSDARPRIVAEKHGERPSVLDWIPQALHDDIRQGTCATDLQPYFADAHDALPRGGTLWIPMGVYKLSAPWALTKTLTIIGAGDGFDETLCATVLKFDAGITGITLVGNNAERSVIRDMLVLGQAAGAGTDDGIRNGSNGVKIKNVTIRGFGRYGLSTDTSASGNANSSVYDSVRAFLNYSHGFYSTGIDSNRMTFRDCSASRNRGWGFYETSNTGGGQLTFNNVYLCCHTETNWLGGYFIDTNGAYLLAPYAEPDGPAGTADVNGTTVTRLTGQSYTSSMTGLAMNINGTPYYIQSVGGANTITLATSAGVIAGAATVIKINQRAELGPNAQYSIWDVDTQFLNAPLVSPLNTGLTDIPLSGGFDNGTHRVFQLGRFLNRLSVRGLLPKLLMEDTKAGFSGTCNTTGTAVARVSGDNFNADMVNTPITINAVAYVVATFTDANNITLTSTAGVQAAVAWSCNPARTYQWQLGVVNNGALSLEDINRSEIVQYYQPQYGWTFTKRLDVRKAIPIFALIDTTAVTGRQYTFKNGQYGAGIWSMSDETGATDLLIYDPASGPKFFFLKAVRMNERLECNSDLRLLPLAGAVAPLFVNASGDVISQAVDLESNSKVQIGGTNGDVATVLGGRLAPLTVLPMSNGGTGATTAAGIRAAISVYSVAEVDALLANKSSSTHTHTTDTHTHGGVTVGAGTSGSGGGGSTSGPI
jgi:hypothetical protein